MKLTYGLAILVLCVAGCGDGNSGQDNSANSSGNDDNVCEDILAEDDGAGQACDELGSCPDVACPCGDGSTISTSSCVNGYCEGRDACEDSCNGRDGYLCNETAEASCSDGVQNGDESGVDCGGSCAACGAEPTCDDGVQNGDETGVDCGGDCAACTTEKSCVSTMSCSEHRDPDECGDATGCVVASEQCGHSCLQYDPNGAAYVNCLSLSSDIDCPREDATTQGECTTDNRCAWYADCEKETSCSGLDESTCTNTTGCDWQ